MKHELQLRRGGCLINVNTFKRDKEAVNSAGQIPDAYDRVLIRVRVLKRFQVALHFGEDASRKGNWIDGANDVLGISRPLECNRTSGEFFKADHARETAAAC